MLWTNSVEHEGVCCEGAGCANETETRQPFGKSRDGSCCASVTSGEGRSTCEEGARARRLHRSRGVGREVEGIVLDGLEGYRSAMMLVDMLSLVSEIRNKIICHSHKSKTNSLEIA